MEDTLETELSDWLCKPSTLKERERIKNLPADEAAFRLAKFFKADAPKLWVKSAGVAFKRP